MNECMKPGYKGNDSMRNLANRLQGGEMSKAQPERPQNAAVFAKGGSCRKGYAMGGVGKIRLKESDAKGNPIGPKRKGK